MTCNAAVLQCGHAADPTSSSIFAVWNITKWSSAVAVVGLTGSDGDDSNITLRRLADASCSAVRDTDSEDVSSTATVKCKI